MNDRPNGRDQFDESPGRGGDAFIHLRVPAALKAWWVRDGRNQA
ncbi:hypothetical protein [Verminephrobacter eiseniae]|nr:hypothetical protein [Verminephrobacter eiseniae]